MNHLPSEGSRPRPLRIAMVVPPWYELPPPGYGGLELVVAGLVDALVARGHAVTVFGAGTTSGTNAQFVGTVPELQNDRLGEALPELAHLARVNELVTPDRFDVVHDHTTLGPLVAGRRSVPTIATVHGSPTDEFGAAVRQVDPAVGLVAISHAQRRLAPDLPWAGTVHNGMRIAGVPRKSRPSDGPVMWLARYNPDKGPELAIEACRAAGLPLVLVGKCNEPIEQRHYEQVVEPMLGPDVQVVTNADRDTTFRLLVEARCLILPLRWEEPFGMVLVEAMATGTPVVALNRGAVPELVRHGVTGLICDREDELPGALREVSSLDPDACVAHVAENFSTEHMAVGYEGIYQRFALGEPVAGGYREIVRTVAPR